MLVCAGKPDRVSNCTVWNITTTSFSVRCTEGYNGGMPQTFYSEANTENDLNLKSNISSPVPRFQFTGMQAGTRYLVAVHAVNMKGRSEPYSVEVITVENHEKTLDLKEAAERPETKFRLSTTMSIVIGVVLSLIVLACLVATALQIHCSRIENLQNKDKLRDETNVYSSNDSVSSGEKNREGYIVDKIIMSPNALVTDGEEREPDLIAQATSDIDERRDYIYRRQHVSTIEAEIPAMQTNLFTSNTLNRSYPSYCTLRNGTMPLQNFSHLNKTNVVIRPNDQRFAMSTCTLPKKAHSMCGPSTSDDYRYPIVYRTSTPLTCAIPEEEHSPSATPLISPKQESAV